MFSGRARVSKTSDGVYAVADASGWYWLRTTHYLKATDFGFSIPVGATISGIIVKIEKLGSNVASDHSVKIVKGGIVGGVEHSAGEALPAVKTYTTYGSAVDQWGLPWTPADINDVGFGVAYSAVLDPGLAWGPAGVDHISITVYYQVAP